MDRFLHGVLSLLIVGLVTAVLWLGWAAATYHRAPPPDEVCWTATAVVDHPTLGFSAIGDVEICGINLHFNGITGPTTHAPRPNSI